MDVSYFGAHGHVPPRVARPRLTGPSGSALNMQVRATARRHRRAVEAEGKDSPKARR
ncbi:hypothetical protein VSH64_09450 [Amycolatopsis rhabdoformis]|uniref:Uncharacterized protein n=1 Tax=Amycolatopsis rhabdoformis TaxID=1448059 RepID=A0ABZ1IF93_9PSEU|nr:hypothetical protein [Amycolatopsis rhabdoformis]WSE32328.1 hypothetical protein VSH64_09450 [Amycolatopsis rhabdoformis]